MRHETPRHILLATAALAVPVSHAWSQADPLEQPFPAVLELSELDGQIGFRANGGTVEYAGRSVAGVGDINGDGLDDVLVGVPGADVFGRVGAGVCYVIYGRAGTGAYPAAFALSDLDGADGFKLAGGRAGGKAGRSVANAGDFNGDGVNDMIIGSPSAWGGGRQWAGGAYVVFGRNPRWAFPPVVGLGDLDGFSGFYLEGFQYGGGAGSTVSSAGDINGDGLDDIALTGGGDVYVVFGRPGFSHPPITSLEDINGTLGFRIVRASFGDGFGVALAPAGDINGDGLDDLAIGAFSADPRGLEEAGVAYVLFGRPAGSPFPDVVRIADLDGGDGFRIEGAQAGERCGYSISAAGDVNSDGTDDLLVGSPGEGRFGRSYVIFGRSGASTFPPVIDLGGLGAPAGFSIDRASTAFRSGPALAAGGDINGDGTDDILIGDWRAGPGSRWGAGQVLAVFGRAEGVPFPDTIGMADLDGSSGFVVHGILEDQAAGASVAGAGDMNGDGVADFIIGAPGTSSGISGARDGRGFVVFGRRPVDCPADFDGDGQLTVFDFLTFGNLFDLGDTRADLDGDGSLTIFDFLAFQNAFDAGCP